MSYLSALAEATPSNRDRYVDFLRAFSIVAIVLGHFFIALIDWEDESIFVHNASGISRACGWRPGCCRSCRSSSSEGSPTPCECAGCEKHQ